MSGKAAADRHRRAGAAGCGARGPTITDETRRCTQSRPKRSSAAASTSSSPPSAASAATPDEQAFNNPGFDILSQRDGEDPIRIEVKARIAGAEDFFVTHNEVMTG